MKTFILTISVAALLGCASPGTADGVDPAKRDLDVCEAVFRYQFEHNASGVQQDAAAYFLTIRGEDPSPEFLARFAGHRPPVRPGSEFEVGKGLRFRVEGIEWRGDGSARVTGGYYEAGLSSSGNVYTVEPAGDGFEVTANEMKWIS